MLMGCRVDYHIRPVEPEHPLQLAPVRNGYNLHGQLQPALILDLQLLLNIVGAVFIHIQHHQLPGPDLGDLAAQLGTDGAAAAGNKHRLAPVIAFGILTEDLGNLPEQELLRVKFPEAPLAAHRLGGGVIVGFQLAAGFLIKGIELLLSLGGSTGDGKHNLLNVVIPEHIPICLPIRKDGNAVDAAADFIPVNVHEELGGVGRVRIAGQVRRKSRAHPSGADDGDVDPPVPLGRIQGLHPNSRHFPGKKAHHIRRPGAPAVGIVQILVNLPHKDVPQQIQGKQGHCPQKFHIPQGQQPLDQVVHAAAQGVIANEIDIQVVAAVAPHIVIGIAQGPSAQHTGRRQKIVQQRLRLCNGIVAAGVKHQQQHRYNGQHDQVIPHQHQRMDRYLLGKLFFTHGLSPLPLWEQ